MYAQAGYCNPADYKNWFGTGCPAISKIVIKGTSAWGCLDEAFNDKVTITEGSITYEYHPAIKTGVNPSRKWSYKTTSPIFEKLYADLVEIMPAVVNRDATVRCLDVGGIEFIVYYQDESKFKQTFFLPQDEFKDCFQIIKQMVPSCEYMPAVLLTEEDYQEEDMEREEAASEE